MLSANRRLVAAGEAWESATADDFGGLPKAIRLNRCGPAA